MHIHRRGGRFWVLAAGPGRLLKAGMDTERSMPEADGADAWDNGCPHNSADDLRRELSRTALPAFWMVRRAEEDAGRADAPPPAGHLSKACSSGAYSTPSSGAGGADFFRMDFLFAGAGTRSRPAAAFPPLSFLFSADRLPGPPRPTGGPPTTGATVA